MFSVIKKLWWFFKEQKKRYLIAISLLMIASVLEVIPPLLIGVVIDDVTTGSLTREQLFMYIGVFVFIMTSTYAITFVWMRLLFGGAIYIERSLRTKYMSHLFKMTSTFFEKNKTGDLMAKATNDLKAISQTAGFGILTLIDATAFLLIILFMMTFFVSWQLTLAAFLPFPIMAFIIGKYGKVIHKRFTVAQNAFGTLNDQVLESVSGARVIRAFVREKEDQERFHNLTEDVYQKNVQVARIDALFEPTIKILVGISYSVGLGYGAVLVFQNQLTIGQLISFHIYLGMLIWPMLAFGELMNVMQRGSASLDRLNETLSYKEDVVVKDGKRLLTPSYMEIRDLSFHYPNGTAPSLERVNVLIKPGDHVGLVGKTGSGKTTFLRQLLREYPIESQKLFINGTPIEEIDLEQLKGWLGYVPQDQFLFSKTIRENIVFAKPTATASELEDVIERASLTSDLAMLKDGLETVVGEKGIALSGGQKQRIAIARALLKEPDILLLDDALSAVDAKTETAIIDHIRTARKSKTTFIAAHRMSAIKHANTILVFDNGHIIASGTHDELMELGGWYREQVQAQMADKQEVLA
ncbi:ATP-binding cassette domain-containing protein [Paenalkalicoccus suaedae]|uniref:ATP-binding cassette domain-containing protein n=1 Tax=Paenalkalicoccus suaedae TaxID=2592382 RepID=A0A859FCD2_9BACI|nr:ABC transporter transmembrane domain-containing protein [Paenalkalicoccus suaedae]QKS70717.1 ATP-binding cassette domain-containing protein [Paenalkalicoccus suaedae]